VTHLTVTAIQELQARMPGGHSATSEEGEDRVRDAYAPQVWSRLVQVKTAWDPDNLFCVNQNIKPSTRASHA
jgi:hypothetical protein